MLTGEFVAREACGGKKKLLRGMGWGKIISAVSIQGGEDKKNIREMVPVRIERGDSGSPDSRSKMRSEIKR